LRCWQTLTNAAGYLATATLLVASQLSAEPFIRDEIIADPSPDKFSVCLDHSCYTVITQAISEQSWLSVNSPLKIPAASAAKERLAIATAVARMEIIVGKQTGTDADRGGNWSGFGRAGQMDCIDESTNSTTYLRMLEKQGYLHHHRVADRATRFGIFVGAPHTTAVIQENNSETLYAVDSWFFDNGESPVIVKLSEWRAGWRPGKEAQ
jgi:hypothetical protein